MRPAYGAIFITLSSRGRPNPRQTAVSRAPDGVARAATSRWALGRGFSGSRNEIPRPASDTTASTIIAATYVPLPDTRLETRIVPAIAVPNDEPRLDTARDRPDISPCFCSGNADCTTFTDGV